MTKADICNYYKGLIIPHTPEDFIVAESFRHGLPNSELLKGIAAFRTFLYELYDNIATGEKDISIVRDIAVVLSTLGQYGRLETEPRKELSVYGADLLKNWIKYELAER